MAVTLHLRVKVTKQYPQTTILEEKDREPNRIGTEVAVLNDQPDRLTLESSWLKSCFMSTETVGLLGTRAQDVHLDFHTAPEFKPVW